VFRDDSSRHELTACRVICVGVNPAFDLTMTLDGLDGDRVNRVTHEHCRAAGKAANVACALAHGGINAGLVGFYGEDNAEEWRRLFLARSEDKVPLHMITCPGAIRQNITLLAGGETVKINRCGCIVSEGDIIRLEDCLSSCAGGDTGTKTAVFTGSLSPGLTGERYVRLMTDAARRGLRIALDIDGLTREQLAEVSPWLYKPNAHELARLTGADADDDDGLVEQARLLAEDGVGVVLLTLGERGLAAVTAEGTYRILPRPVTAVNTVGAGDAALAAFVAAEAEGCSVEECARRAARSGEQAVTEQ